MDISLQQAIEIHARSLTRRFGTKHGKQRAYQEALRCRARGDDEGFAVWVAVSESIPDSPPAASESPAVH
ncbi:MAG: hypothetical protein ACLPN5_06180 [Roseiarcus sp.]